MPVRKFPTPLGSSRKFYEIRVLEPPPSASPLVSRIRGTGTVLRNRPVGVRLYFDSTVPTCIHRGRSSTDHNTHGYNNMTHTVYTALAIRLPINTSRCEVRAHAHSATRTAYFNWDASIRVSYNACVRVRYLNRVDLNAYTECVGKVRSGQRSLFRGFCSETRRISTPYPPIPYRSSRAKFTSSLEIRFEIHVYNHKHNNSRFQSNTTTSCRTAY